MASSSEKNMNEQKFVSANQFIELMQKMQQLESQVQTLQIQMDSIQRGVAQPDATADNATQQASVPAQQPVHASAPQIDTHKKKNGFFDKLKWETQTTWEVFLGGNIFAKLGLFAILLAVGWFIKMAFDNRWINESARIFLGLIIGYSFITASFFAARKKIFILPAAILGAGFAVLFISLYGAYYYYDLLTLPETFAFFILLSLFLAFLARKAGMQTIYIFSALGAFLAPLVLSQGENSYRFLFTYISFINILFLFLSLHFRWRLSQTLLIWANGLLFTVWASSNISQSSFVIPFIYITLTYIIFTYILLFAPKDIARDIPQNTDSNQKSFDLLDNFNLLTLNIFYFISGILLFDEFYPNLLSHFFLLQFSFLLLINRQFYLSLYSSIKASTNTISGAKLSGFLHSLTIPLAAAAIFRFFDLSWQEASFLFFTIGVSVVGAFIRSKIMLTGAFLCWIFNILFLFFAWNFPLGNIALFHQRFFFYLSSAVFLALTYYIEHKKPIFDWSTIFAYLAIMLLLIGSLLEVNDFVTNRIWTNLGYTLVFGFYAMTFLSTGLWKNSRSLRLAGLVIMALALSKFYLYDIWIMTLLVRIVAGFILGIVLLVFSLFYQKFRDQIMENLLSQKKIKTLLFSIIAIGTLNPFPIQAKEVNISSFLYYKELKIPQESTKTSSATFYTVRLDKEIYQAGGSDSIRLSQNGQEIPYLIRQIPRDAALSGTKKPKIIFQKKEKQSTIYILQLPIIPEGTLYNTLALTKAGPFDSQIKVESANIIGKWKYMGSKSIYQYKNQKNNRISLNIGRDKFLRLTIPSTISFQFPTVSYRPKIINKEHVLDISVNNDQLKIDQNKDTNSTIIYLTNIQKRPISRFRIRFKENKFYRKISVYQLRNKYYQFSFSTFISSQNHSEEQIIQLPNNLANSSQNLKVEIFNEDNEPLNVQSMQIYTPIEQIVFQPLNGPKNIRLYYGNKYIKKPKYEFAQLFKNKGEFMAMHLGKRNKNEDFSYSIVEPPVSSWIIRIVFILGILGIAFPAFKIYKKYVLDIQKMQMD